MNELTKIKTQVISQLSGLCAHCATRSGSYHRCPVREISARIQDLRGVPLIVNSEFKGVLFSQA